MCCAQGAHVLVALTLGNVATSRYPVKATTASYYWFSQFVRTEKNMNSPKSFEPPSLQGKIVRSEDQHF